MRKGFYSKLAITNIKKNGKNYIPFILSATITIAMFYMISSLSQNTGLDRITGSDSAKIMLMLGTWVTAIFAVIFLFYTNSFLIKRRKKEFGLYNILGMEKKHLLKVIGLETIFIGAGTITLGILIGVLLDKLMYLAFLSMFDIEISFSSSEISIDSILFTLTLFGSIFFVTFLNNLRQIHMSSPIELLRGSSVGEKEPKTKWITAIFGVLCIGTGYVLSVTIKNPMASISIFFVAVILVITGTYCVFTTGSIVLLKMLRKNKKYYYKTKNFVAVSGMIYRMKQNAVGLANICVLSTMVLVMVSSTLSLNLGLNDIISGQYPRSIIVSTTYREPDNIENAQDTVNKVAHDKNKPMKDIVDYTYLSFSAVENKDHFSVKEIPSDTSVIAGIDNLCNLVFITQESYNKTAGTKVSLNDKEVLVYSNSNIFNHNTVKVFDEEFEIKEKLDSFVADNIISGMAVTSYFIVVKDFDTLQRFEVMQEKVYGKNASSIRNVYGFNVDADKETTINLYKNVVDDLVDITHNGRIECQENEEGEVMALYGGFLFIGIFLGSLFIMATILIMYYKQMSEGHDDKSRFEIMQKVGMSRSEIKRSINSQVLTVFFLPLVVAGIHVVFAFPLITKILKMLYLTNVALFTACTIGCFIVFAIFYTIVYSLTAKVYYKIVS